MRFIKLVSQSRSVRRFDQSKPIAVDDLIDLVEAARLAPSGMNKQPLKYIVTVDDGQCRDIFPLLGWAGYLKDWQGPKQGERPTGYIVLLLDKDIRDAPGCDHGIAAQTIMLGATEKGLGGCIIGSVNQKKLMHLFDLEERYEVLLVLALGVPIEEVVIEPLPSDGKIEYWRTSDDKHHVPKRSLDEVIVGRYPQK